jgi:uncharacterized protein (DUF1684 family)
MRKSLSRSSAPGPQTGITTRISRRITLVSVLLVLALPATALQPPDPAYLQSFEKWKAELVQDLKQRWLVLAGLFWLKPGTNTFGAASDNSILLASGPAHAGAFQWQGSKVSAEFYPGTQAKIEGKPVRTAKLQSDAGGQPTVVEMGSLRMFVISRGPRLGIRVQDLNSAAARTYAGPVFFPLDLNYRVSGTFVASDGRKTVDVPNVLGDVTPMPSPGEVHFKLGGRELTLTALSGDPEHGLSFVISDLTSKTDTYPGGRFLDTDPVVDGKVVLDFNRAYNPPCAVTPYATCPLAPKENRLPIAISAGEKYDRKNGSH